MFKKGSTLIFVSQIRSQILDHTQIYRSTDKAFPIFSIVKCLDKGSDFTLYMSGFMNWSIKRALY